MSLRQRQENPDANKQVGTIDCLQCGTPGARVHRRKPDAKRQDLYYFCDECGCIQPSRPRPQVMILETIDEFPEHAEYLQSRREFYGVAPEPAADEAPEPAADETPEPAADEAAEPAPKGLLSRLAFGDDDE